MGRRGNKRNYTIEYLFRPGEHLSDGNLSRLARGLRDVASECFDPVPEYQCLLGERAAFADKVITVARDPNGEIAGFCSAILIPVRGVGLVLHLGLTCVSPSARGASLTHRLTSTLIVRYLLGNKPLGKQWITNVACVLSSLGNVAMNFEGVFPAPGYAGSPSETHRLIAEAIDQRGRDKVAINDDAEFDPEAFVFRRSVKGTSFQKRADDTRYRHRDEGINDYYCDLMNFDDGDEVLQVGHIRLMSVFTYAFRRVAAAFKRKSSTRPALAQETV